MAYPSVGVLQASDPLDQISLHGRDLWFDAVHVSDSEFIATYFGWDGLFPGGITPLERETYEWRTRMIFSIASLFFGPDRWKNEN